MKRLSFALLLLAALGCGNRQKTEGATDAASTASTEQPPPRLQRTPPPDAGPAPTSQATSTERPATDATQSQPPADALKPAPGLKGLLIAPTTPGASRVALDGCLAQAEASESAGSRFPAPAPTRGPSKPSVSVAPTGGGVLVEHELVHGCCLHGDVKSSLEGRTVTLVETLSGETCRCRCRTTVRAAVGLSPGDYTLRVVTEEPGHRQVAYEGPLSVH